MPTLPPGSPVVATPVPVAALVFTPTPAVQASVRIYNPGPGTVYVGGANVQPNNGFPVLPGNRPIELQNIGVSLYACCGVNATAALGIVAAATAAGVTALTVPTVAPTAGTYIAYGNGTNVEYLLAGTVTGAVTPWTVQTSATRFDHAANSTAATVTAITTGPVTFQAGVG
jgi:hypothetical protein